MVTQIYVEFALFSGITGSLFHMGNSFFTITSLNAAAIQEIRSTLHRQAIEAMPSHPLATEQSTYLQIVSITILDS